MSNRRANMLHHCLLILCNAQVDTERSFTKPDIMVAKKSFRFLDLPAELRNEVYACYLPKPANPIHVRRSGSSTMHTSFFYARRQLARVNRQIRAEFLSRILRDTDTHVLEGDVDDYVLNVMCYEPEADRELTIKFGYGPQKIDFELIHLLRYLSRHKKVKCNVVSQWYHNMPKQSRSTWESDRRREDFWRMMKKIETRWQDNLQNFLRSVSRQCTSDVAHERWLDCVNNVISSITVRRPRIFVSVFEYRFKIRVNKDHHQPWMNGKSPEKIRKTKEWVQSVGMPEDPESTIIQLIGDRY
jgi:hypothetical protein